MTAMRLVLWGDGESPHLLKWARALAPQLELWAASSRGFLPGFDALLPAERRLALGTTPRAAGGNVALLRKLPLFANWLRRVRPDWVHAHYLSSHGTLAWLATTMLGAPGRLVGSAWGSDVLVTPQRSALQRGLIGRVLRACALTTSDSMHMAQRMRELGAGEVMCFPFGLEALPPLPAHKDDALFFANRGLEPIYAPQRVLDGFAAIAAARPQSGWWWPTTARWWARCGRKCEAWVCRTRCASSVGSTRPPRPSTMRARAGTSACRAAIRCRCRYWKRWPTAACRCCRICRPTANWCATVTTD
jgi:L-malate glycosyltransferase